jgi:DNA-binding MarR family transcriptional regulator
MLPSVNQIPAYEEPVSRFTIGVFRVNAALLRNGNRLTKSIGQSSARWNVLGRIGFNPQTVAQIAQSMGLARQSVQRIADALVREELATYIDKPDDKRTKLLLLTPKGETIMREIDIRQESWAKAVAVKLGTDKLTRAAHLLEELAAILEYYETEKGDEK